MGPAGSLARQLLVWQLLIVFALLGGVAAYSTLHSNAVFRDTEGRKLLAVAENVAATPGVRASLAAPARRDALPSFAEGARTLSGADAVVITDRDGRVLTAPDPALVGRPLAFGDSTVRRGRAWVGEAGGRLAAHVPVVGDAGRGTVGYVAVSRDTPGLWAGVAGSPGTALALLAITTVIGVAGSFLLASRVKRQTLGLEPREITGLIEHREALLHGIKEGVIAMDRDDRVTLVNDRARELLALPADAVGTAVDDLRVHERLRDVLTGRAPGADQIVLRAGRVLVINRLPVRAGGRLIGAVATLRDRTELATLREELAVSSRTTDTLRAQAHEFTNRLHTIAGLIELGEYDEARSYVNLVSSAHDDRHDQVTARIEDPAVAALLIAKASLAAERGIGMRLAPASRLAPVDEALSGDLVTVVGNLVDNALDALSAGGGDDWVEAEIRDDAETADGRPAVVVVVRDSGPGVAPEIATEVFRRGFTTKAAEQGRRGLGLALTRQICVRRGGSVDVRNDSGAEFTAVLPSARRE
ncbi:ATP-binding protein [Actinomadura kijaniata]|uniref:histidine kinase n=1 Tax=Actinomadura namibiensis TaxID=182080 RepID=A0A7W3LKE1_ACTNM|nr:sensor histidine kinase [Actinomadura namibiensis]MBA8949756.1 sensor histidine kinase regulating citrate/malate metabolism [Actinomadura namibiensis]